MAEANKEVSVKKGFAAVFDAADPKDIEVLRILSVAKTVGGVSAKKIVELGVKAYIQTNDFKEKVAIIKKQLQ